MMPYGPFITVNPLALMPGGPLKMGGYTTVQQATRPAASEWVMGAMSSTTVSCGVKEVVPIDAAAGYFKFSATNKRTGETIAVSGKGAGVSVGAGLLPCDISGDLPLLPGLPSWHGEFYLGPAGRDSMGYQLFQGVAILSDFSAAALINADYSVLAFMSTRNAGRDGVKVWTPMAGLSWDTNASVGGSVVVYNASVNKLGKTTVIAGNPRWKPGLTML